MFAKLKHQIELTFEFVRLRSFCCAYLDQSNDVLVPKHLKDFYLSQCCDWKAFFLVLSEDFLESDEIICLATPGLVDLAERALADLGDRLVLRVVRAERVLDGLEELEVDGGRCALAASSR